MCSACSNRSADSARPDASTSKPDPRAAFERIVKEFKHYYRSHETLMSTGSMASGGQHLKVRILVEDVSYTIDDSPGGGAEVTAEMTVRTRTEFALLNAEPDPDRQEEATGIAAGSNASDSPTESPGSPSEERSGPVGPPVDEYLNSRNRERVDTVSFAYRDNRWELIPQEDLDPPVRTAVEFALGSQI